MRLRMFTKRERKEKQIHEQRTELGGKEKKVFEKEKRGYVRQC